MLTSILKDNKNLFIRLYKYRPHKHHTPQENFVTESFSISLSIDRELLSKFSKTYLYEDLPDEFYIDTQVRYQDSIFDIVLSDDKTFYYIIECKMNASFAQHPDDDTKDQLDKYAEILAELKFQHKGMIVITVRNPPVKQYENLKYAALRWVDIRDFFKSFPSESSLADTLRMQFVELLEFLKVDRTMKNNRLLWKCDICGLETNGQGILSHKNKHCREYSYIIKNENQKRQEDFLEKIKPYNKEIENVLLEVSNLRKIEMKNFNESDRVIEILDDCGLPKKYWLYVVNKLGFWFSNKAFQKFQGKVKNELGDIQPELEPTYMMNTYENLLLFKDKLAALASSQNAT